MIFTSSWWYILKKIKWFLLNSSKCFVFFIITMCSFTHQDFLQIIIFKSFNVWFQRKLRAHFHHKFLFQSFQNLGLDGYGYILYIASCYLKELYYKYLQQQSFSSYSYRIDNFVEYFFLHTLFVHSSLLRRKELISVSSIRLLITGLQKLWSQ